MTGYDDLPDYRDLFDLSGKTVMITGACGILGRHFSAALSAHGAALALVDLEADATEQLARALHDRHGTDTLALAADISRPEQIQDLITRTEDRFGAINVLHNNAATKGRSLEALFAPAETYDPETWRELMATNLDGAFFMLQAVGGAMKAAGNGGSIIQTASIYGVLGPDQRIYEGSRYMDRQINSPPSYTAAKSGLIGLTKYFAAYWGADNIRVNAISPGGVESGQNQTFQDRYGARIPMGRMGKAEEMVGALIWLASDASSYVTGQNIMIDGGLDAW